VTFQLTGSIETRRVEEKDREKTPPGNEGGTLTTLSEVRKSPAIMILGI
jgi:hypothetical protein